MISVVFAVWLGCGTAGPEPVRYTVKRGDTLFLIGRAQGVTVEQLRAWNHLSSDTIEVGQELLLFPGEPAPEPTAPKRRHRAKRVSGATLSAESQPVSSDLRLPAEKACLSAPTDVDGDHGMAAARGLDEDEIRRAMSTFVPATLRCMTSETPSGTLELELTVACTGRVALVSANDGGGLPSEVVDCVRDVLRYAAFPAHDYPDGFTFGYPLRYQAP